MFASRPHPLLLASISVIAIIVSGCATNGDTMTKDQARDEVHARVDGLAEHIGTNPTVSGEGAAGMDPNAPTLHYSYRVNVDVDPDKALDELRGPIADEMREHGWTVDYDTDLTLVTYGHDDGRAFVISVFPDDNYANIIGNTPFKNPDN